MMVALLAPEYIILIAFDEWLSGSNTLKRITALYPDTSWTETHAQFAIMGGFKLVHPDGHKEHLYKEDFFRQVQQGNIQLPTITKEEIQDRSNGDAIAKTIVVIQITWFVVQAIHRASQGLPVTELELTTLAHTSLNIFIYWCWWNKPLAILFPVDAYPNTRDPSLAGSTVTLVARSREHSEGSRGSDEREALFTTDSHGTKSLTPSQQLSFRVRLGAYIHDIVGVDPWSWQLVYTLGFVVIVTGSFGAIHCLAWNDDFITHIEAILWRVSSLVLLVLPSTIVIVAIRFVSLW
ncbi:hypothetical protein AX17_006503 [Amanita inopinata Kibby_2008]|nr:hypothetical protein AX17_006503 [Amanita inopinata Kibby_2008]